MSLDAQFQIRQNAMEMQEYMKDLFEWEKSIKKKERAAARAAASSTAPSDIPAPRGRAGGVIAAASEEMMRPALDPKAPVPTQARTSEAPPDDGAAAQTAAAHTYTAYSKWDKFDVDAALASDEEQESGAVRPRSAKAPAGAARARSPPPPVPVPRPPAAQAPTILTQATAGGNGAPSEELLRPVSTTKTAPAVAAAAQQASSSHPPIRNSEPMTPDAWRTRGNDLFKVGEFASARECYSRSLELQPTCLAYANRAMTHLKLNAFQDAIEDCTAALDLDPGYVKAYQRRGAARRQLGQLLAAAQEFEEALRLEPGNKATAADRDAVLQQYMQAEKLQHPSRRTRVPLTVHEAQVAVAATPTPQQPPAATATEVPPAAPAPAGPSAGVAALAAAGATSSSMPAIGAGPEPVGAQPMDASSSNAPPAAAALAAGRPVAPSVEAAAAAARQLQAQRLLAGGSAACKCPKTSVEFEGAWRGMQGDCALQAAYLSSMPPGELPRIFKNSMTAPVLTAMLRCLLQGMAAADSAAAADGGGGDVVSGSANSGSVDPRVGVQLLAGLVRVPRFDMTVMSVPGREKQELRPLWDAASNTLAAADVSAGAEFDALRPKYRL